MAVGSSHLTGHGAFGGSGDDLDIGDVVLRTREASGLVDGACARCLGCAVLDFFVQVLCEDDEPACAEHAGVDGVDDGVEDEDEGQADDLERLLRLPDGGEEPCDQSEDDEGVDVVAELERVEVVAGEDGEDAVEAGDLVEEDGEEDEFGGGAEGDEAQYGLRKSEVSMVCDWRWWWMRQAGLPWA